MENQTMNRQRTFAGGKESHKTSSGYLVMEQKIFKLQGSYIYGQIALRGIC